MKKVLTGITIVAALSLLSLCAYGVYAYNQPKSEPVAVSRYEAGPPTSAELLELVNAERAKTGASPLSIDENVQSAAQIKADDMHNHNYFSHEVKGTGSNLTPEMNVLFNASCSETSENILWIKPQNTSLDAFSGWMNSAPHKAAILNAKYTKTGIAIAGDKIVEAFCVAK